MKSASPKKNENKKKGEPVANEGAKGDTCVELSIICLNITENFESISTLAPPPPRAQPQALLLLLLP